MQIDIVTLFPNMFDGPFSESIIKRAVESGKIKINLHDLRKWGKGDYRQVDDKPFGGGAGMVLMIEPIVNALDELKTKNSKVVATTAKGETYKQSTANKLSEYEHLIILAGHYEGFDQRVIENYVDFPISIGNYVLTGGELPAMVIVDSITRLIPGALGNENSASTDSYYQDDKTIQYPQYTRPAEFKTADEKILKVPDVLTSGNHGEIEKWRDENLK